MKFLLLLLFAAFLTPAQSQVIGDIYSITEFDPCKIAKEGSNIVVLYPLPFTITYIIELKEDTFVKSVELDRNIDEISLSIYENGEWVSLDLEEQKFNINKTVRYLLLRYKEDCKKVYMLIQ